MRLSFKPETQAPRRLDFTEQEEWVKTAVETALAHHDLKPENIMLRGIFQITPAPGCLKVDGRADLITLAPCSSCQKPFHLTLGLDIAELFCAEDATTKHVIPSEWTQAATDITYVTEGDVDLAALLTERIRIELPYYCYCSRHCTPMALDQTAGAAPRSIA